MARLKKALKEIFEEKVVEEVEVEVKPTVCSNCENSGYRCSVCRAGFDVL